MQVQCDDITYLVLAQAMGVTNQTINRSFALQDALASTQCTVPPLTVDVNKQEEVLGLAWKNAPRGNLVETNVEVGCVMVWLRPLCACARHAVLTTVHGSTTFLLGVRPNSNDVCYVKVCRPEHQ